MTEKHLGGHCFKTWIDAGALRYLMEAFGVRTMIDVGCGPGGMRAVASDLGIEWTGVDGDPEVAKPPIIQHDFSLGPLPGDTRYDLGWSVEFLEHVHESFQPNYMEAFSRCRVLAITAAPPGWKGHHHVHCRDQAYWADTFAANGFRRSQEATEGLRRASTMRKRKGKSFITMTGMVFISEP